MCPTCMHPCRSATALNDHVTQENHDNTYVYRFIFSYKTCSIISFRCPTCEKEVHGSFVTHLQMCSIDMGCPNCNEVVKTRLFYKHLRKKHGKKVKCPAMCQRTFTQYKLFARDFGTSHICWPTTQTTQESGRGAIEEEPMDTSDYAGDVVLQARRTQGNENAEDTGDAEDDALDEEWLELFNCVRTAGASHACLDMLAKSLSQLLGKMERKITERAKTVLGI